MSFPVYSKHLQNGIYFNNENYFTKVYNKVLAINKKFVLDERAMFVLTALSEGIESNHSYSDINKLIILIVPDIFLHGLFDKIENIISEKIYEELLYERHGGKASRVPDV